MTATPNAPPSCMEVSLVAEPTPASAIGSDPITDSVEGARPESDPDTDADEPRHGAA